MIASKISKLAIYGAWLISIAGFLGSLVYSELLKLPPCDLCIYQRMALYPLVIIFLVGILRNEIQSAIYALPLTVIGGLLALYQVLLQAQMVPNVITCRVGVSCAEIGFKLFGLVTIPQQSLLGFMGIFVFCVIALVGNRFVVRS